MAEILWTSWQKDHIEKEHGVSREDFDSAWHDPRRHDLAEESHEKHGPFYKSVGAAIGGRALMMIWRWQGQTDAVWPITAFFPKPRPKPQAKTTSKRS